MYLKLFTLTLCFFTCLADEIKKENHVLVLTKDNFKEALKNKNILVEFYAPWCGHCKALEPQYAKAAEMLQAENSELLLAKVDATQETELAEEHGVSGYPTIKFFKDGKVLDYTGGRTAEDIIWWLKRKIGPPAVDLSTVDAAKTFIDSHEVAIIGFFKDQDSSDAKEFKDVANEMDAFMFGITSDDAVYSELKVTKDSIVLFKKFDEGRNELTEEVNEANIKKFIKLNSLPIVVEFSHVTASKIFGGDIKVHNLLFISKSHPDVESHVAMFGKVAPEFKGKVVFVTVDVDEGDHVRIMEYFGLKKEDMPSMRVLKLEQEMARFKPETNSMEESSIRDFTNGVLEGKIKQHLLSEEVPEDWDKEPVKVLVGKNFDEVAFDKSKNVLVEFYAPWCGHCKQLAPIYDELGEKYKDNANVVIAKMDATTNELAHTKINNYPTIKLFKKGTNEVVDFNGERTLEGLQRFIDTDGVDGAAVKEEEEDEEEEKDDEATGRDEL